jgi:SAM-dependent methyltransferase
MIGVTAPSNAPIGGETMSPSMRTARNYYAWIAAQFAPVLGQRVLDIGGGYGSHLEHVVDGNRFVMSLDLSAACVADMRERFRSRSFDACVGDITDPGVVCELAARRFDTIVCVNVLEHIERDRDALGAMRAVLAPAGGRLFLLVPAHPFLYGTPDALAGHHRRYRRRELVGTLRATGFTVRRAYYFNAVGALPYLVNARLLRPKTLGGAVDAQLVFFDRFLVPIARPLESVLRLPFGQSLIAIAEVAGG